jgi:hypothetical protein
MEICQRALAIGFVDQDQFVLMQKSTPAQQYKTQLHARKNHSYLWIFRRAASPAQPVGLRLVGAAKSEITDLPRKSTTDSGT